MGRMKAKEPMKKRLILLPVLMAAVFALFKLLGMGTVGALLLGVLLGAPAYFCFVVLKVQRLLGQKETAAEKNAHEAAAQTARRISQSGIVLLQNRDDFLPLPKGSKLNLVGLRCVQMNYNGGGSAASDESKCITLEDALRQTGFQLNQDLLNLSYHYLKNGKASIAAPKKNDKVKQGSAQKGGAEFAAKPGAPVKPEIDVKTLRSTSLYDDGRTVLEHGRDYSEIALVVLSRGGGEGYDFDPADLRLLESERKLLDETCGVFDNVILVLNTANTVEMGWLKKYPQIKAVLWIGFPGVSGNLALGDILCGDVCPSGHLPDTWADSNLSAPAANNFCQMQEDGTWSKQSFHYRNAPEKKGYFLHYSEGIYVGYRYFETRAAVDPAYDYEKEVVWPFGFGLSYTSFEQKILSFDGSSLSVAVRNTGKRAGSCVVQCYVTAPYTGKIEKSAVSLVSFGKTGLLQPGEQCALTLQISQRNLASFDTNRGVWVLEAGDYILSIRSDSHTSIDETTWSLEEELVLPGTASLFADADTDSLTRSFDPNHRAFTGPKDADFVADIAVLEAQEPHIPTDSELGLTVQPMMGKAAGLLLEDMKDTVKDDPKWDTFISQLTLPELCDLCGNGAWQTRPIERLHIPATKAPDGSTSMSATVFSALVLGTNKAGITWPCPSVLAASFDTELAKELGNAVGIEGNAMGYQGWYAPSMNCHRTAFNSRNFEYYSEDPLLSGKIAANVVKQLQSHKIVPYIKHFALNERETNARDQLFTWCSEQAMREIYFLPFEMAVREGHSLGVMSSFNYIGHTWAGGNRALLTELLRKEWGFEGTVVTDACLYPYMNVAQMIYAGGSISLDTLGGFMGGNCKRKTLLAYAQQPERRIAMSVWLQQAAKDILYMVSRTL